MMITVFQVFLPYVCALIAAIFWFTGYFFIVGTKSIGNFLLSFLLFIFIFIFITGIVPNSWLWPQSTQNQNDSNPDVAVILSFGYDLKGDQMEPGAANIFLWTQFVTNDASHIKYILVQEGIWVAADEKTIKSLEISRFRIHQHNPNIYIDTPNAAYCALQQLQKIKKTKVLLISHDLQLQRVLWDFQRVSRQVCSECKFYIPKIEKTPFPTESVHWWTRNSFFYKIVELLILRPRDFLSPIPTECKVPVPN